MDAISLAVRGRASEMEENGRVPVTRCSSVPRTRET